MKFKKLMALSLVAVTAACGMAFAACGGDGGSGGGGGGGTKTYTFEAEYINLEGKQGAGYSSDQGGLELIYGDGTEAQKNLGWSNGYYVSYLCSAGLQLDFVFNADKAGTATIVLRLGSEDTVGDLTLNPSTFDVKLNNTSIPYQSQSISSSPLEAMRFYDKTISTNARLVEGENVLSIIILENDMMEGRTGAPSIDCVKVTTSSVLTWSPKTDNPSRRGEI